MIMLRNYCVLSPIFLSLLFVAYTSIYQITVSSSSLSSSTSSHLRGKISSSTSGSSRSNVHDVHHSRRIQSISSASAFFLSQPSSSHIILTNATTSALATRVNSTANTTLPISINMTNSSITGAAPITTSSSFLSPYYMTNDLGNINYDITLGNPLKGLAKNPLSDGNIITGVKFSLEAFYIRFDSVVRAEGGMNYNWTTFEKQLNDSYSRNVHVIPRFYITYPGEVIALPPFLLDNVTMKTYSDQGIIQYTPYFGDPLLLKEIQNFIVEFGKKYDGDVRIAFIQAGILGFWGEWHCLYVHHVIHQN
jgi:hypothetical protein